MPDFDSMGGFTGDGYNEMVTIVFGTNSGVLNKRVEVSAQVYFYETEQDVDAYLTITQKVLFKIQDGRANVGDQLVDPDDIIFRGHVFRIKAHVSSNKNASGHASGLRNIYQIHDRSICVVAVNIGIERPQIPVITPDPVEYRNDIAGQPMNPTWLQVKGIAAMTVEEQVGGYVEYLFQSSEWFGSTIKIGQNLIINRMASEPMLYSASRQMILLSMQYEHALLPKILSYQYYEDQEERTSYLGMADWLLQQATVRFEFHGDYKPLAEKLIENFYRKPDVANHRSSMYGDAMQKFLTYPLDEKPKRMTVNNNIRDVTTAVIEIIDLKFAFYKINIPMNVNLVTAFVPRPTMLILK